MFLFEVKTKQDRVDEQGREKSFKEYYLVEAASFGDAEERITEQLSANNAPVQVLAIKHANLQGLLLEYFDKKYDVKVVLVETTDTGKESKQAQNMLISADDAEHAYKRASHYHDDGVLSYLITNIKESRIDDVFLINQNNEENE